MSDTSSEQPLNSFSTLHLHSRSPPPIAYIVSSDGDRIPVEPHLAAQSTLWRIDNGFYEDKEEYNERRVLETSEKIRLFLLVLDTGTDEGPDSLRTLWELGEKYRARKVVKIAEKGIRELLKSEPLLAFTIAAQLHNEALMSEAAHATLKQRLLDQMALCGEYVDAPAPAKRRLEQYHFAHLESIRASLRSAPRQKACSCYRSYQNPRAPKDSYETVRNESFSAALDKIVPATIPHKLLRTEVELRKPRVRGCKGCENRLDKDVAAVKEDWEARGEIVVL